MGLEWADVDFERRQIQVRHSDWAGELIAPKNGRIRVVGMTKRLASARRRHRHLRSSRVLCKKLGTTQRYMHLSPAALDAAIRRLEPRGNSETTALDEKAVERNT